jgi:hypothetical protein
MGLAFFLLFPLVKLFRGMFTVSLLGFVTGKFLIPLFFIPNFKVGSLLLNKHIEQDVAVNNHVSFSIRTLTQSPSLFWDVLTNKGFAFLLGSAVNGAIVSLLCYFLVYWALNAHRKRKAQKKYKSRASVAPTTFD